MAGEALGYTIDRARLGVAMRAGIILAVALATGGCAAKRGSGGVPKEEIITVWFRADAAHFRRTLPASLDSVWVYVPHTFEALHFPGGPSIYPSDYMYLTPTLKIERRLYQGESNASYLNCGFTPSGVPAADVYQVTFAIAARLLPQAGEGTEVDIVVDGTAHDMVENRTAVRCDGTGRLEAMIFRRIEAMLRANSLTPGVR